MGLHSFPSNESISIRRFFVFATFKSSENCFISCSLIFSGKRGCSVVHLLFHFSLSPYLVFLPLFIDLIIIHPIELVRPLKN